MPRLLGNQSTIGSHFAAAAPDEDAFWRDEGALVKVQELLQELRVSQKFAAEEKARMESATDPELQKPLAEQIAVKEAELNELLKENHSAQEMLKLLTARPTELTAAGMKKKEVLLMHLENIYGDLISKLREQLRSLDAENSMLQLHIRTIEAQPAQSRDAITTSLTEVMEEMKKHRTEALSRDQKEINESISQKNSAAVRDAVTIDSLRRIKDANESQLIQSNEKIRRLRRERDAAETALKQAEVAEKKLQAEKDEIQEVLTKERVEVERLSVSDTEKSAALNNLRNEISSLQLRLQAEERAVESLRRTPSKTNDEVKEAFINREELRIAKSANKQLQDKATKLQDDTVAATQRAEKLERDVKHMEQELQAAKNRIQRDEQTLGQLRTKQQEHAAAISDLETSAQQEADDRKNCEDLLQKTIAKLENHISAEIGEKESLQRRCEQYIGEKRSLREENYALQTEKKKNARKVSELEFKVKEQASNITALKTREKDILNANQEWSATYKSLQEQFISERESNSQLKTERDEADKKNRNLRESVAKLKANMRALETDNIHANAKIKGLEWDLKQAEQDVPLEPPIQLTYEDFHDSCLRTKQGLEAELERAREDNSKLQDDYNNVKEKHRACFGEFMLKNNEISLQKLTIQSQERTIQEINNLHGECPGRLQGFQNEAQDLRRKLIALQAEHEKCPTPTTVQFLQAQNQQLQAVVDNTPNLQLQLDELKKTHSACPTVEQTSADRDEISRLNRALEENSQVSTVQQELQEMQQRWEQSKIRNEGLERRNSELERWKLEHESRASTGPVRTNLASRPVATPRIGQRTISAGLQNHIGPGGAMFGGRTPATGSGFQPDMPSTPGHDAAAWNISSFNHEMHSQSPREQASPLPPRLEFSPHQRQEVQRPFGPVFGATVQQQASSFSVLNSPWSPGLVQVNSSPMMGPHHGAFGQQRPLQPSQATQQPRSFGLPPNPDGHPVTAQLQGASFMAGPNFNLSGSMPPSPITPGHYMLQSAMNSPQQRMGPPQASPASPTAPEYSFLISGTPTQGQRTLTVAQDLRDGVEAMRPIWLGKSQNKTNKTWLPASVTKKCVESKLSRLSNHMAHEDPDDPKTACPRCVRLKLPCIIAYPGHRPAVLPLPIGDRSAQATPFDKGYYIQS